MSSGPAKPSTSAPTPHSPAWFSVLSRVHARYIGGCGSWCGFGMIGRRGMSISSLLCSNSSASHIFGISRPDSSSCAGISSSAVWNAPASWSVPPLPMPKSTRPFDRMSSIATRSATLTGWFMRNGRHTTPCPMRMRFVFAATYARKVSGALMCAYHSRQWCSTAHTRSKPISSASTACSTQSCITWNSALREVSCVWASKIIENFTGALRAAGPC